MPKRYKLISGKDVPMPLPQKPGYKIVGVKIKQDKDIFYIFHVTPVYKRDKKSAKNPLTDFHLN